MSIPGLLIGSGVLLALIFVLMDDTWAAATNISLTSAIIVLSIVVLTGYAGQLSLGQWALAGCGALIAGSFVLRFDMAMELAIPLGVLLTIPIGLIFALPALRTRGVNLAIVYGLVLIVAFSVGLAATITGIGLVAVLARRAFARMCFDNVLVRALPALSAAAILAVGIGLTLKSLPEVF